MMDFNFDDLQEGTEGELVVEIAENQPANLGNLELILVTSSMNHEYASQELDKTRSYQRRQEILAKMARLRELYFAARERLHFYNPDRVEEVETDLRFQKQQVFSQYNA